MALRAQQDGVVGVEGQRGLATRVAHDNDKVGVVERRDQVARAAAAGVVHRKGTWRGASVREDVDQKVGVEIVAGFGEHSMKEWAIHHVVNGVTELVLR